jgi:hexokinase
MAASNDAPHLSDEALSRICEQLGLKTTKKNRILVARLVKQVGTDTKKLSVALKKATILS